MDSEIPVVVEALYRYFVTQPDPCFWPDYFKKDPIQGHGLWAFYQGLRLGVQVADAALEKR